MKLQKIAAIISAAALALALTGCGKEPDNVFNDPQNGRSSGTTLNPFESKPAVQLPDIPVNEASAFEYKYDSELGGMVITDYKMQSPKIHIPDKLENEKVVKVDFGGVEKDITHIIMPDSVKEFGLSDQIKEVLQFVNIPASVTKLEPQELDDQFHSIGCFEGYSSLTSIAIPNSVTEIGKDAFNHCTSLTSVNIPGSVTEMGDGVFGFCTSLTSVTIPYGMTQIGDRAFEGCTSLESVIIPGSLNGGDWVFCFQGLPKHQSHLQRRNLRLQTNKHFVQCNQQSTKTPSRPLRGGFFVEKRISALFLIILYILGGTKNHKNPLEKKSEICYNRLDMLFGSKLLRFLPLAS